VDIRQCISARAKAEPDRQKDQSAVPHSLPVRLHCAVFRKLLQREDFNAASDGSQTGDVRVIGTSGTKD
jgi:hypothetical protein